MMMPWMMIKDTSFVLNGIFRSYCPGTAAASVVAASASTVLAVSAGAGSTFSLLSSVPSLDASLSSGLAVSLVASGAASAVSTFSSDASSLAFSASFSSDAPASALALVSASSLASTSAFAFLEGEAPSAVTSSAARLVADVVSVSAGAVAATAASWDVVASWAMAVYYIIAIVL